MVLCALLCLAVPCCALGHGQGSLRHASSAKVYMPWAKLAIVNFVDHASCQARLQVLCNGNGNDDVSEDSED